MRLRARNVSGRSGKTEGRANRGSGQKYLEAAAMNSKVGVSLKKYRIKPRKLDVCLNSSIDTQLSSYCKQIKLTAGSRSNFRDTLLDEKFHQINKNTIVRQKRVRLSFVGRCKVVIKRLSTSFIEKLSPSRAKDKVKSSDSDASLWRFSNNENDGNNNRSKETSLKPEVDASTSKQRVEGKKRKGGKYQSYPLSRSEDSVSEECDEGPKKPVPSWAKDPQLKKALRSQGDISPDTIFATPEPPDIYEIFPFRNSEDLVNTPEKFNGFRC